ncbi:MAG: hypothetical protein Q7S21_04915 [archaeon]|nr:hypothetical protein [archaeon]
MNLLDLKIREEKLEAWEIFPAFDLKEARTMYGRLDEENPHETILNIALNLWKHDGYEAFLKSFGFHDLRAKEFSGHCHQITPILGIILKINGFKNVKYLESYRIDSAKFKEGTIEKMSPALEANEANKQAFIDLGRIPYCCLEVKVGKETFYVSGKHIKKIDDKPQALLRPECYANFTGVFHHQNDESKSGIYLKKYQNNPTVWSKQTFKDSELEYFAVFAEMELQLK